MKRTLPFFSLVGLWALSITGPVLAQSNAAPLVRLAILDIDHNQLEGFKAASLTHMASALAAESGILAFHAVAEKDRPDRIRVFEMYVDAEAYRTHLDSPHFKTFVQSTSAMVTRRELHDTVPVRLGSKPALPSAPPLVRVAELAIHADQLAAYKAAVTEEIDASIAREPGVIAIYAVALKEKPEHLRFFEIYADEQAYRQHIASPHFRKYVELTKNMISDRLLIETAPIVLRLKRNSAN